MFGMELPFFFFFWIPVLVILFQALKKYDRKNVMRKIFRPILTIKFTLVLGLAFAKLIWILKGINKLIMFL